jgi:hypothetical protein
MAMVNEFLDKYEDYKREALEYYEEHKDKIKVPNLEKFYPSLAELKKKFYLDIVSFEIALPAQFSEVNLQEAIEQEKVTAVAKNEAKQEYQEEYRKQIDTHMSKINDFVGEVTSTLRGKILEHCTVALDKINNKEVVSDKSVNTLLKHIQEFREMNFVDDKAIEEQLNKVEGLLSSKKDFTSDKNAIDLLKQHLNSVVTEAKTLTDVANVSGEYFRRIKI